MNWRRSLAALSAPNYRLFFIGQAISLIGTWMSTTAGLWLAYHLSSSALMLGVISFAGNVPIFICAPFAGVWVDRVNRHRLLILTQTLSMVQSLTVAALTFTHVINMPWLIGLTLFQGLINGVDLPVRQAMVLTFIERKEHLSNAIALNSSQFNLARLLGPALAGFVIVFAGAGGCFLVDGLSYLAVIFCLLAMKLKPEVRQPSQRHPIEDLREGFRYALGTQPIRSLITTVGLVSFLGYSYATLAPVFAREIFHGDAKVLGYLMSSVGVGALFAAAYLGSRTTVRGLGKVITLGIGLMSVGSVTFGLSRWFPLSLVAMSILGVGGVLVMASSNTLLQWLTDDARRGRVMSIFGMAFTGTLPLGNLLIGAFTRKFGVSAALVASGGFCALVTWNFYQQLPAMRATAAPLLARLHPGEEV